MTLTEAVFAVSESHPDKRRFRFETVTRPRLNKKSRATGEPTNFTVEVRSRFAADLGASYEKEVNDAREAQGLARDFEAQKPRGKHYVNGTNWLMESDTEPGKYYAALSGFADRETTYYVDGVEATPERLADLRANYLPASRPSASPVEWRTYSLDSITSITPA